LGLGLVIGVVGTETIDQSSEHMLNRVRVRVRSRFRVRVRVSVRITVTVRLRVRIRVRISDRGGQHRDNRLVL
jgi:hypothetical protein